MSKYGNTLVQARPDLAEQWSPRNPYPVAGVKPGSSKKAWWVGPCGHEWESAIDNRVYGNTGCPFCSPTRVSKVLPGFNDLETRFPEIAKQWHPTKNDKKPSEVAPGSKQRAWWLCEYGHEFYSVIKMRTGRGTGCMGCRGRVNGVNKSGSIESNLELISEWDFSKNKLQPKDVSPGSQIQLWWKCEKGHEWQAPAQTRTAGHGCKICALHGTSNAERDLSAFVSSLGVEVRDHHRQIDPRYEYDVTVPALKIAIEFNGLYWHSIKHKPKNYHLDKTLAAEAAGWSVIHVWEDDWRDRREVVERMLARKLGVSTEERLNARDLEFRLVPSPHARKFLDANHIQGAGGGSWRGGLFRGDEVVALMLMKSRGGGDWELTRFATSSIVRGAHSRLLKRAIEELAPKSIVTFADRCVSDGGLYEDAGFVVDGEIAPDYMYSSHGATREHKFNYRLKRFREDSDLKYVEGLTEWELAELNNLHRVYDAGKVRWALRFDKGGHT